MKSVNVGDAVKIVNEEYTNGIGLVTCVHGEFREDGYKPCINVIYISADESKHDPYGRQTERLSSLQHFDSVKEMPTPGRYYDFI